MGPADTAAAGSGDGARLGHVLRTTWGLLQQDVSSSNLELCVTSWHCVVMLADAGVWFRAQTHIPGVPPDAIHLCVHCDADLGCHKPTQHVQCGCLLQAWAALGQLTANFRQQLPILQKAVDLGAGFFNQGRQGAP